MSNDYIWMHIDWKLESTNVRMDENCDVPKQCLNAHNCCVQKLCIDLWRNLKCKVEKRMQEYVDAINVTSDLLFESQHECASIKSEVLTSTFPWASRCIRVHLIFFLITLPSDCFKSLLEINKTKKRWLSLHLTLFYY